MYSSPIATGRRKLKSRILLLIIASGVLFVFFLSLQISPRQASDNHRYDLVKVNPLLILDDFSSDPSKTWTLLKDAIWNGTAENMVLASTRVGDTGVIWLKKATIEPFTVEFFYYVGGGNGGNGFVFMFYKDSDYDPGAGRFLGFACRPDEKPCSKINAAGYGVEWDTLYNNSAYGVHDPSPSHIALIKDNVNHHLTYVNDTTTKDNDWHRAKIIVKEDALDVYVDKTLVLTWNGSFNRTYSQIGFGASSLVHYDWHIIDSFKIYGNTIKLNGLQQGWTVDLVDDKSEIVSSSIANDRGEAVIDVTSQNMPLNGYFKIHNETGGIVFASQAADELWGGDSLTLTRVPR